jgi:hypothetical protein
MSDSAHKFISTYFQKIIDECRGNKLEPIKSKCQHALQILKDLNQKQTTSKTLFPYQNEINIKLPESKNETQDSKEDSESNSIKKQWHTLGNILFDPLQLACETNLCHLIEPALDCIQKLLGYGYIQSITPDQSAANGKKSRLISRVAKTITSCYAATEKAEGGDVTQVQIVKAIHAAIITPTCALRGSDLSGAIEAMIKIYLNGSRMIAGTANGMIDHTIVEIVFGRIKATPSVEQTAEIRVIENRVETTENANPAVSKKDWKDANLVFTQLCKLCGKNEEKGKSEKIDEQTKLLCLGLIDQILESSHAGLQTNDEFIHEQIKKNLCSILILNGIHQNMEILKLTLSIADRLVTYFREHLKEEIFAIINYVFASFK